MVDKEDEIWRYVALSEYQVPRDGSTGRLSGLGRAWKAMRAVWRDQAADRQGFQRAARKDLDGLVPRFEVEEAAGALRAALGEWSAGDVERGAVRVVVGPPGTYTRDVVAVFARGEGWAEVEPPQRADLLVGGSTERQPSESASESLDPFALPGLERWFVRSERSLPAMRALLEGLRRRTAPTLVGCDSWAWSFLDSTLGVRDLLGEPLALAPLDGAELARWLEPPLTSRGLVCRPTEQPDETVFGSSSGPSATLLKLARVARGNPGLALELWRRGLRVARDGEEEPESVHRLDALWAAPLGEAPIPIPHELGAAHEIVLHAALLHAGVEESLLSVLVPFPRHDLSRRVRELVDDGLLGETDGELVVPLAAYAGVRAYLASEGYLVDGL